MSCVQNNVSSDARLVEILDAYLAAVEAGTAPTREVLLAQHPDLASELQACLASLEFIQRAAVKPGPVDAGSAGPPAGEAAAGVLGDFRILREVGRGGMGVVYEAEQSSLQRRVALKVLPLAAALDNRRLQRFLNEARAAAGLHHTNIVPVYAVGSVGGVHFYAMQYIEGQTVAGLIRALRREAGLDVPEVPPGGQAASHALAVSPVSGQPDQPTIPRAQTLTKAGLSTESSIRDPGYFRMVGRVVAQVAEALEYAHQMGVIHRDIKPGNLLLDQRGIVWITDFGLAQLRQSEGSMTQTGDLVGTLRYMSPEQAQANRAILDQRTDVYSLGATLYELLILQPVFAGASREELLQQIMQQEPVAPRRRNRAVPVELETIVLKTLEKDPADRYTTAQALADDVRRWLEDRPIQARRPSLVQRARKWARRHRPALTGLAAAVAVLGLAFITGLVWHNAQLQQSAQRERQAAQREREAAEDARIQRDRAKEQRQWARQAVDDMYTDVAEKWLQKTPRLQPLQRQFLEKALRYYEHFGQEPSTTPEERLATVEAYRRVADIRGKLGKPRQAIDAYRLGQAVLDQLATAYPRSIEYRVNLALIHSRCGVMLDAIGAYREAEKDHRQAVAILGKVVAEAPGVPANRHALAKAWGSLANVLAGGCGRPKEAEEAYSQAIKQQRQLVAEFPGAMPYWSDLEGTYHNLGALYYNSHRSAEGEKALRKAREIAERLLSRQPTNPNFRLKLADTCSALGLLLYDSGGQGKEIEESLRRAETLLNKLVEEFPDIPEYREILALTEHTLGIWLEHVERNREAEEAYRAALQTKEHMVRVSPGVPLYREDVVETANELTLLLRDCNRLASARKVNLRARTVAEQLVKDFPTDSRFRRDLGHCHERLAQVCQAEGDFAEAVKECRRALKACPDHPFVQRGIAWILATLPAGYGDPIQAVELAQKATRAIPLDALCWRTLGLSQLRAGDAKAAVKSLQRSLRLEKRHPTHTLLFLSMAQARLGNRAEARRCYDKAIGYINEGGTRNPQLLAFRDEAAKLLGLKVKRTKATNGVPKKK